MGFYRQLVAETKGAQERLFEAPFIRRALQGELSLEGYLAFLESAYHHVHHTVPLLMATGAALPERHRWVHEYLAHYIEEENGHDDWILSDIAASGGDPDKVRLGPAPFPVDVMVAYAYDVVRRRNPLGFFGMVHVLESASVRGATDGARRVAEALGIPANGVRYLSSHGEVDHEHVEMFGELMDRVHDELDQAWIVHCANRFSRLYQNIFLELPEPQRQGESS